MCALSNRAFSNDLKWPWRSYQLFKTAVNPLSWKCSIWLLLCDSQLILGYNFGYRNDNEGLLKVTGGHVRDTAANKYFRNGARDLYSHNGQLIRNDVCTVELCHYLWPWVTFKGHFSDFTCHICPIYMMHRMLIIPFDDHCCHMGTAIKHPVPDRAKSSSVL